LNHTRQGCGQPPLDVPRRGVGRRSTHTPQGACAACGSPRGRSGARHRLPRRGV